VDLQTGETEIDLRAQAIHGAELMRVFDVTLTPVAPPETSTTGRPKILGLAHIALYAHDFEATRAFYRDFLGFEEPYSNKNDDGSIRTDFFKINDRQYIELSPETKPGTDRLNHIAIETDDAEAMRVYLGARGVKVPATTPKGRIGNLNYTIKDPDGHTVEIVQYPSDGMTAQNYGKFMGDQRISRHMTHVGILVGSLEEAKKFYGGILGFKETWRGGGNPAELSWVNMKAPDGDDYIEFELYKNLPPETERGGKHHLCLEVPNVEAAIQQLEKTPYAAKYTRPLQEAIGVNRKRQANLYDPDGTRTEVMEPLTVDTIPAPNSKAPPPR